MKKILSLLLALALLCAACVSLAEDAEIQEGYRYHQLNLTEPGHPFAAGFYLVDAGVFPPAGDGDTALSASVYILYDVEKCAESPVSQWNLYVNGECLGAILPVREEPASEGYVLAAVNYLNTLPCLQEIKTAELVPVGTDGKEMQEKVVLEYGKTLPIGYVIDVRFAHHSAE